LGEGEGEVKGEVRVEVEVEVKVDVKVEVEVEGLHHRQFTVCLLCFVALIVTLFWMPSPSTLKSHN
jgi:hypothetical protein